MEVSAKYFEKIVSEIQEKHIMFYAFLGTKLHMLFSKDPKHPVSVKFSKIDSKLKHSTDNTKLNIVINPFSFSFSDAEWKFIIAHQFMHYLMKHHYRYHVSKMVNKNLNNFDKLFHTAADICVNHMLEDLFEFDKRVFDWKKYSWVQTVFENPEGIGTDESLEFYLELLKNESSIQQQSPEFSHDGFEDSDSKNPSDDGDAFSERKDDESGKEDAEETDGNKNLEQTLMLQNDLQSFLVKNFKTNAAKKLQISENKIKEILGENENSMDGVGFNGLFGLGSSSAKSVLSRVQKINVEELELNYWNKFFAIAKKTIEGNQKNQDSWTREARRFSGILSSSPDLFLPTELEIDDKNKMELSVFIDTSKYCSRYTKEFAKLAKSIPKDLAKTSYHSFGNKVIPIKNISEYAYNGGGAYLSSIEKFLLSKKAYPKNVLIITDGMFYDSNLTIKHPDRWFFVITNEGNANNLPKSSHFILMKNLLEGKCKPTTKK